MPAGFVVAIVGAESTGKSTLAVALVEALAGPACRVALVGEYLREFCDQHARTPRLHEQRHIAEVQMKRIETAAAGNDIVIADTTALMTAVYSDLVFGDRSLYLDAEHSHSRLADAPHGFTLLTALDLPWQADGLQRDGPQVRTPVDTLVRAALGRAACAYAVVSGTGGGRLASALASVERARQPPESSSAENEPARWHGRCERCGDAACERHALLPGGASRPD